MANNSNFPVLGGWIKLGTGSYNWAFRNASSTQVLKIQKDSTPDTDKSPALLLDKAERSVGLWNIINKGCGAPAFVTSVKITEGGRRKTWAGWVCPFVSGRQSTDNEIQPALIRIFNSTGRILADAVSPRNFLTTDDGKVVCVDIGMALQLDPLIPVGPPGRSRRGSIISRDAWSNVEANFSEYFTHPYNTSTMQRSTNTVKALLFVKFNRPDICDADFLVGKDQLVNQLAAAYDGHQLHATTAIGILNTLRPQTLSSIKESCVRELQRYIESRGAILYDDSFEPSFMTKIFRNQERTREKIEDAKRLIKDINSQTTSDGILGAIRDAKNSDGNRRGIFSSGLGATLTQCAMILQRTEIASQPAPRYNGPSFHDV